MPYKLIKHHNGLYSVVNKKTGEIHSRGTTKAKAISQMRLLYMIEHKMKWLLKKNIEIKIDLNIEERKRERKDIILTECWLKMLK